jgi:hypothetical protein
MVNPKDISFLQMILTGSDNITYELGRILWFFGTVIFFGLAIYSVVFQKEKFDALTYGLGLGSLLGLGGFGIERSTDVKMKDRIIENKLENQVNNQVNNNDDTDSPKDDK